MSVSAASSYSGSSSTTSQDVSGCHIYSSVGPEQLVLPLTPPESPNDRLSWSLWLLECCRCAPRWSSTLTFLKSTPIISALGVHTAVFTDGLLSLSVWAVIGSLASLCELFNGGIPAPHAQKTIAFFPITNKQNMGKQRFPLPPPWMQVRAESPPSIGLRETHFNHLACFQ